MTACELYEKNGEECFDSTDLFDAFVKQSFKGASGLVTIDPNTTSRRPFLCCSISMRTRMEVLG
jgi:hypothetical protein